MLPTLARAFVTPRSASFYCCAKPFTELTRLGTRSARRWYWLTTSDQLDLTCSSLLWIALEPQLVRLKVASAASTVHNLRIESLRLIFAASYQNDLAWAVNFSSSFRGAQSANPESRANNLEIPGLRLTAHPGMTVLGRFAADGSYHYRNSQRPVADRFVPGVFCSIERTLSG